MFRPARQQLAEDPRGRALSHRHAPGQTDHIGHLDGSLAEECRPGHVEYLLGSHVEIKEPGERQVDVDHLVHRHTLVESLETKQVFWSQRQRSIGAQPRPLRPAELGVP